MDDNYILGLHIGHDATACLLDGTGKVIGAIAEERLTRVKYHMGFPFAAVEELIRMANISKQQISDVVLSTEHLLFPGTPEYNRLFFLDNKAEIQRYDIFNNPNQLKGKWGTIAGLIPFLNRKRIDNKDFRAESKELTLSQTRIVLNSIDLGHCTLSSYDHHMCHAASALYTSGEHDGLMITMDGAGDGNSATASIVDNDRIKCISRASSEISPGRFYSEITGFCGFKRLRHEGKITGLAAHGNPEKYYSDLKKFIQFDPVTESFFYDKKEVNKFRSKWNTLRRILNNQFTSPVHIAEFYDHLKKNYNPIKDMADLAAAGQKILEDLCVEYVGHFINKTGKKKVLLAGGVFANVRVNQVIAEIPGVEFIFIHQNMGDGGLALGGAMIKVKEKGVKTDHLLRDVYLGPEYSNEEIEKALQNEKVTFQFHENIEAEIARLIHDGKVIGRFDGRMEYGPRALGNRSILAAPTDKTINDWLNKKLNRTEFMPFAPSMLTDRANEVLKNYNTSPAKWTDQFMTITYDVKEEWHDRTQATTHIDGTARPQVVHPEGNPSYYKLIKAYYDLSGIPLVINTSFNMHEEPIVTTPEDAIRAFRFGCLDFLAIGNYLCDFKEL